MQWESLILLLNDGLKELVREHWDEAGIEGSVLDVDWPRYGLLEEHNVVRWMGHRKDGKLIGYASMSLTHPLHNRQDKTALLDTIFLTKEHRQGLAGAKIVDEIEGHLKTENADIFIIYERERISRNGVGLGSILQRKGFRHYENGWMKRL